MIQNKIVAIHQPDFLPYFGFFKKMYLADSFIYLDNVQISRGGWTDRDKIKTRQGAQWIKVNIKKANLHEKIRNVKISYDYDWQSKSLSLIYENYKLSRHFEEIYLIVKKIFSYSPEYLIDFNLRALDILRELLGIKNKIFFSSDFNTTKTKNDLLVELLKKVNANTYLSGQGAKDYLEDKIFLENNINVIYNNFDRPIYEQQYKDKKDYMFIEDLSIIDYLFNCGIQKAKNYLKN